MRLPWLGPSNLVDLPIDRSKKGIAGGTAEQVKAVSASWSYEWRLGIVDPNRFALGIGHVPMIWGKDYVPANVKIAVRRNIGKPFLIWNEPEAPSTWGQSSISPAEAAKLYGLLRILIHGVDPTSRLIVGGVYFIDLRWAAMFASEYKKLHGLLPKVEGWHVHHYADSKNYDCIEWRSSLRRYYEGIQRIFGGVAEFWITEFGSIVDYRTAERVMKEQVPWLQEQEWVTRYAWYSPTSPKMLNQGRLFDTEGGITKLGMIYRNMP